MSPIFKPVQILLLSKFRTAGAAPNFWLGPPIVHSSAPVKSRQEDHLYPKLVENCDALIFLSCRDFTGAGDRTIEDRAERSISLSFDFIINKFNYCCQELDPYQIILKQGKFSPYNSDVRRF